MGNDPVTGIDKNGNWDDSDDQDEGEAPPDIIITGSDNKTLTIKAPGPNINLSVNTPLKKDQTIDLGISSLSNLAIGYSETFTAQLQLLYGGSVGGELDHVLFF